MEILYSYADYVGPSELIELLKRFAKAALRAGSKAKPLSAYQDDVARRLGYLNWSLLHKHIAGLRGNVFWKVRSRVLEDAQLGPFLRQAAVRIVETDQAVEEMKAWARAKYTPLINFAYHDSESETGYSWPAVDMVEELEAHFQGSYPDELIQQVGQDLDVDEGPWGLEE